MIGNTLGPVDRTVSVMIDRAYPVVKAVYLHLKEISTVYDYRDAIVFVSEHVEEIQNVQDAANVVQDIHDNLEEILQAGDNAARAETAAQESEDYSALSKRWAIETETPVEGDLYGSKYYADQSAILKRAIDEVHQDIIERQASVEQIAEEMEALGQAVQIVADNIEDVNTTADNITYINTIAHDFTGATSPVTMPDWGEVGVNSPLPEVITGGSIYTVAVNIQHVLTDAVNINHIIRVSENLNTLLFDIESLQGLYPKIHQDAQMASEAKTKAAEAAEAATNQATLAETSAEEAEKQAQLAKQYSDDTWVYRDQAGEHASKAQEANQNAQSARQAATQAQSAAEEAQHLTEEIRDQFLNPSVTVDKLPEGSNPTAVITPLDGAMQITFGIPKGDTGAAAEITEVTAEINDQVGIPSVQVTSGGTNLAKTIHFSFSNLKGEQGHGVNILGTYDTLEALQQDHPTGTAGDCYAVKETVPATIYVWDPKTQTWSSIGAIASNEILMDPDPVAYFDKVYGTSSGDIIGTVIVSPDPIVPDPTDTFETTVEN